MFSVCSVRYAHTGFRLFTIPVFITRNFKRNFLSNISETMWGCSLSRTERTMYGKLNWETLSYSRTEKNQNLSQLVIACLPHRVWGWSTPPTAIPCLPLSSLSVLPHCSHSSIPHFTHSFLCVPLRLSWSITSWLIGTASNSHFSLHATYFHVQYSDFLCKTWSRVTFCSLSVYQIQMEIDQFVTAVIARHRPETAALRYRREITSSLRKHKELWTEIKCKYHRAYLYHTSISLRPL